MILIAESKTMSAAHPVDATVFSSHAPMFETEADRLMISFGQLSDQNLAKATGLTAGLLAALRRMISDFPDKSSGEEAIRAFTGVVFRQLHTDQYSPAARQRLDSEVRIISSVYGWLRPTDIIKPYRLDFRSRTEPGGINMMQLWRKSVTEALLSELRANSESEIINLLPGDAAGCIDWKAIDRVARVWRVDFKVETGAGVMKSPDAGRLKRLRGQLLDLALSEGAVTARAIARLEGPDFMPADDQPTTGTISFITA